MRQGYRWPDHDSSWLRNCARQDKRNPGALSQSIALDALACLRPYGMIPPGLDNSIFNFNICQNE